MAETDALKKFRGDVQEKSCNAMVVATKSWIYRELQASSAFEHRNIDQDGNSFFRLIKGLLPHNPKGIENWSDEQWESFTLKLLWRICLQGVLAAQQGEQNRSEPAASSWRGRHRNYLLAETNIDSDAWVHETLIRFCGGFIDQGFASWHMPARDTAFFHASSSCFQCAKRLQMLLNVNSKTNWNISSDNLLLRSKFSVAPSKNLGLATMS